MTISAGRRCASKIEKVPAFWRTSKARFSCEHQGTCRWTSDKKGTLSMSKPFLSKRTRNEGQREEANTNLSKRWARPFHHSRKQVSRLRSFLLRSHQIRNPQL